MTIGTPARNPVLWGVEQAEAAMHRVQAAWHEPVPAALAASGLRINRIGAADLRAALAAGLADFRADPTHYVFLCILYPAIGLVLGRMASGLNVVPLVFPLVAGFALLGPFAAIGLYELSRRREAGEDIAWWQAFTVVRRPGFAETVKLGLALTALFLFWLVAAEALYLALFGWTVPVSAAAFLHSVLFTRAGWALILAGHVVGLGFAILALGVGVVSFPLMVDRGVPVERAVRCSIGAVRANPGPMALWGLIVAVALIVGSVPFLLGLAVVVPVLGHATWHLYRRVISFY